ncbi:MAG: hypothetical protein J7L46_04635, partial [Bacteroidales bacterium]|nr:hypothetical protein [Bacteroidales bacterium]
TEATNESGFTALPGGSRFNDGAFLSIGNSGLWWSSTETIMTFAWDRHMGYNYSNVYRHYFNKEKGFSVRCVRDN